MNRQVNIIHSSPQLPSAIHVDTRTRDGLVITDQT